MKGIDTFTEPFEELYEGLKPQSVIFGVLLGVLGVLGYCKMR
jgi:hypothetical protein